MKELELLSWLTIFIITLKSVSADYETPSIVNNAPQVLCPNSPIPPINSNQVVAPQAYQPTATNSPSGPCLPLCPNPACPPCSTTNSSPCPTSCSSSPPYPTCSPCSISISCPICTPCWTPNSLPCQTSCPNTPSYQTCPTCSTPSSPCSTPSSSTPSPTVPSIPSSPACPPPIPSFPITNIPPTTPPPTVPLTTLSPPAFPLPTTTWPPVTEQTTYPPLQIVQCPTGTLLVNNVCRLIYCGTQSIYREGRCLRVECPEGSNWNGWRCEITSEPIVHTITYNNTLVTLVNSLSSPIEINNFNNFTLNSTSTIDVLTPTPLTPKIEPEETTEKLTCCNVITPRVCKPKIEENRKKWVCYSKRYRRCGDFCVTPIIILKAPYPSGNDDAAVLPPDNYLTECRRTKTCAESNEMYDCSGCISGRPESCSSYCYKTICPPRRCKYYNQRNFCEQYPGEPGCLESDGCFSDWCGGNAKALDQEYNLYDDSV